MRALTCLVALVAAVVLALPKAAPATALAVPERYQFVIAATGWQPAEVPMLAAVVECESSWDTFAVGQAGELGLLQFQTATWEYVRSRGSEAPPAWESWWWPSAQFYQARQLYLEQGWGPWTCSWPYL